MQKSANKMKRAGWRKKKKTEIKKNVKTELERKSLILDSSKKRGILGKIWWRKEDRNCHWDKRHTVKYVKRIMKGMRKKNLLTLCNATEKKETSDKQ